MLLISQPIVFPLTCLTSPTWCLAWLQYDLELLLPTEQDFFLFDWECKSLGKIAVTILSCLTNCANIVSSLLEHHGVQGKHDHPRRGGGVCGETNMMSHQTLLKEFSLVNGAVSNVLHPFYGCADNELDTCFLLVMRKWFPSLGTVGPKSGAVSCIHYHCLCLDLMGALSFACLLQTCEFWAKSFTLCTS